MKYLILFISLFNLILMKSYANFSSCEEITEEKNRISYNLEEIKEFSELIVRSIRLDLRLAKHTTNRYLACFKNDEKWKKENLDPSDIRDKIPCQNWMKSIRNRIKKKFPEMRKLLALSMGKFEQNNYIYNGELDPEKLTNKDIWRAEHIIKVNIKHHFSGFSQLSPLSLNEIKKTIQFLHDEEIDRTIKCEQEVPNMKKSFSNTYNSPYRKACYTRHYKGLLFGDNSLGIRGFPLLAYLNNENPSDIEIIQALNKVNLHLDSQIEKIEDKYYNKNKQFINADFDDAINLIKYEGSVDRFLRGNNFYCDLAHQALEEYENGILIKSGLEIGVILGGVFACSRIFKGLPLKKGICNMQFGLGFNLYFAWNESSKYNEAIKAILLEPDGNRSLITLDQLDSQELSRFLSIVLLPVGTGLPEIKKAFLSNPEKLRAFLKRL